MINEKRARRLVKSIPFSNQDGNYEITAFATESGYDVRAKKNGRPLRLVYSMDYGDAHDFQHQIGEKAYDALINLMLNALLNKMHEPR